MDKEHVKKILAGLGIAGLISGAIAVTPDRALSAWGGGSGAGSTKEQKTTKEPATVSPSDEKKAEEEKAKEEKAKEGETKAEKPAGQSSCTGSKK